MTAVDTLRREIREWNTGALLAKAGEEVVEHWCDLVTELTAMGPSEALAE
ncbi:MAG: hypothetical protein ABWY11_01650 [Umezawaea sp.]